MTALVLYLSLQHVLIIECGPVQFPQIARVVEYQGKRVTHYLVRGADAEG